MKKRYFSPSIECEEMDPATMVCMSGTVDKESIENEGNEDLSREAVLGPFTAMCIGLLLMVLTACGADDQVLGVSSAAAQTADAPLVSTIGDRLELLGSEDLDAQSSPTRSALDADGGFDHWSVTDKISISDGTLTYVYRPREGSVSGASCSFEGKPASGFGSGGKFYAFYPADAVVSWSGTSVTTMVYAEQDYTENREGSGVMGPYMVAKAVSDGEAGAHFTFGHACSVIDVDLSAFDGGEVESVALYANSQISLAGRVQYDFGSGKITVSGNDGAGYSYSSQSEVVRVSAVNAVQPTVRFYVLPVKQERGLTVTVRTADGKYYTKSSATALGTAAAGEYVTSQSGITNGTLCKPYYKKYNFGTKASARLQNWLAMIPGNVKFNHLSLPGTHDAATSSGTAGSTAAAKCQDFSISEQLERGCRALDLRPGFDQKDLTIYHGVTSTDVTLQSALSAVKSFLADNPTETVFVLIHEEDTRLIGWGSGPHQTIWATRVWNCLNGFTDCIARYGWKGNLNPCRGKMVVIFRDNYTDGDGNTDLGCGKVGWGSSFNDKSIMTGNGSTTANGTLRYQDEYDTADASTKLQNLTTMLKDHIAANETNANYLFVNNTNIASGLSSVAGLAGKVNSAVLSSAVFTAHTGRFGVMMTDFLFSPDQKGDQMFELIHRQNYKYVYKGRSRSASAIGTDTGLTISADEAAYEAPIFSRNSACH